MKTHVEVIRSLQSILQAEPSARGDLIKEFQDENWSDEIINDQWLNEILSELHMTWIFMNLMGNGEKRIQAIVVAPG